MTNDTMKSITVRMDDYFYSLIKQKAAEKGIKLSRYIRMLIERGLVMESQFQSTGSPALSTNSQPDLLPIIASLSAENTMLLRYLYRRYFDNDETFQNAANKIYEQSQQMLTMMQQTALKED